MNPPRWRDLVWRTPSPLVGARMASVKLPGGRGVVVLQHNHNPDDRLDGDEPSLYEVSIFDGGPEPVVHRNNFDALDVAAFLAHHFPDEPHDPDGGGA